MESSIYNMAGERVGSIQLPERVFGVRWNDALMHQVVHSMLGNARERVAHVKDRGDVRGGGRKPWRQKGTGRARHGSIRSPIWRGGGVTHGPRSEKSFARSIPKKMRAKALFMALSRKLADGEVVFVERFGMEEPKTAAAKQTLAALSKVSGLEKLSTKRKNAALIALSGGSDAARKSFRNIGSVETADVRSLNPVSVLGRTYLIIENPKDSVEFFSKRLPSKLKAESKNLKPNTQHPTPKT